MTPHWGGRRPLPADQLVRVLYRDGSCCTAAAGRLSWVGVVQYQAMPPDLIGMLAWLCAAAAAVALGVLTWTT